MASKKNIDPKDVVKKAGGYGGGEDGSYVFFDSRTGKWGNPSDKNGAEGAKKSAKVLNDLAHNNAKAKAVMKNSLGVFRGVNSAYSAFTYGQEAIQGFQDLVNLPIGADVIQYDTEAIGTPPHMREKGGMDIYSPTELGFDHYKVGLNPVTGKRELQATGNSLSLLISPNENVFNKMSNFINDIVGKPWTGAHDDIQRSLRDLTLYAGKAAQIMKSPDGKVTSVNAQNRTDIPMPKSVLSSSENVITMTEGLNVLKNATKPVDMINAIHNFMSGMNNPVFAGFNVYGYDKPFNLDYFGNVLKNDASVKGNVDATAKLEGFLGHFGKRQLDGLHIARTLLRNRFQRFDDSTTLERIAQVLGIDTGTSAHHALSDSGTSASFFNYLLSNEALNDIAKKGGIPGGIYGHFDPEMLMSGDLVIATNGLSSSKAGTYDGVYRRKNGAYSPINDMKPNPIYNGTTYRVENWLENVEIEGKKMFGLHLHNLDDDLDHFIYRDSLEELKNVVHGHLGYIDKYGAAAKGDNKIQNLDRARRRWQKMFSTESGGGYNLANRMYSALDVTRKLDRRTAAMLDEETYTKQGMTAKEAKKKVKENRRRIDGMQARAVMRQNEWNTDSFVRDFRIMRSRLEGEESWIKGFIKRLDNSGLAGNSDYQRRAKNLAFKEFGNILEARFGKNESKRNFKNNIVGLNINVGGTEHLLQVNTADSIRGNMYNIIRQGRIHGGGIANTRARFRELLIELKSKNALNTHDFEEYYKNIDKLVANGSIDSILNDLANKVIQARERNSLNGTIKGINIEDPTKVVGGAKRGRAHQMHEQFDIMHNDMFNEAINRVTPYHTWYKATNTGKSKIPIHGVKALDIIEETQKASIHLLEKNGLINNNNSSIKIGRMKHGVHQSLTSVADAYMNLGFHVQFRYDGKRDGMQMLLLDHEGPQSALDMSLKDIMAHPIYKDQVSVINLPKISKDGTLTLGSTNRASRLLLSKAQDGYEVQTGFDQILGVLKNMAPAASNVIKDTKRWGKKNGMLRIDSMLNSAGKKAIQNLSMNSRFSNPSESGSMFQIGSNASNWLRSGTIDISAVAEDWYTQWYHTQTSQRKDLWKLKEPQEVKELAINNKELFVNSMGVNARRVFQRQSDDFVKEMLGIDVGMHSVKDVHASNYIRSILDARQLLPGGFDNPMGRENIQKTPNYLSLEQKRIAENLKAQGMTPSQIERVLTRGVMTDRAMDVLEDAHGERISYLNVHVAYMDNQTLNERITQAKKDYVQERREVAKKIRGHVSTGDKEAEEAARLRFGQLQENIKFLSNPEAVSLYDGNYLMSKEMSSAFETTREKKFKMSSPGEMPSREVQKIMSDALVAQGKSLDLSQDIVFNGKDMPNVLSDGKKVTVTEIVQNDIKKTKAGDPIYTKDEFDIRQPIPIQKFQKGQEYDKWYAADSLVKHWNAEDKILTVEEKVRAINNVKNITTGGQRLTMNNEGRQEVLEKLSGKNGVQAIMPSFDISKNMWGTVFEQQVGLGVHEIKTQIEKHLAGESEAAPELKAIIQNAQMKSSNKITAGKLAVADALDHLNEYMREAFGITKDTMTKVDGGRLIIDEFLNGHENKMMEKQRIHGLRDFMGKMDGLLGTDFSNSKVWYGNEGIGLANVHNWENSFGMTMEGHEGIVRYGMKEVDMIAARANEVLRKAKLDDPSVQNHVTGWLQSHLDAAAKAQHNDNVRISSGLIKSIVDQRDYAPKAGDVVIRTRGKAFTPHDPSGEKTGRISSTGAYEISMHAFNQMPEITARDTVITAEEYAGTILDMSGVRGHAVHDSAGNVTHTFEDALKKSGGTAFLQMPDDGFIRDHVRLVDFGDITKDGTAKNPILREIQKTYKSLDSSINDYIDMHQHPDVSDEKHLENVGKKKQRINDLIMEYEDKTARLVSDGSESGIQKMLASAKMSGSGRFRIQGVNPFANYEQTADGTWQQKANAKYKEGTLTVSRERLREMLVDENGKPGRAIDNIVNIMDIGKDVKGLKGDELVNKVLDNVNEKGLYGVVHRWPFIKQSAAQSLQIRIDENAGPYDRAGRLSVGTAINMKADYDGDFLSSMLAHYGESSEMAKNLHDNFKIMQVAEAQAGHEEGAKRMQKIFGAVHDLTGELNMSVQDIVQHHDVVRNLVETNGYQSLDEKQRKIYNAFDIKSRRTAMDALETREARLGKEFVGFVDNTRYRLTQQTDTVTRILVNADKMTEKQAESYRNLTEKFGAAFSQDSISAKKFTVANEIERIEKEYEASGQKHRLADRDKIFGEAKERINSRYLDLVDMDAALKELTPKNRQTFLEKNKSVGLFDENEELHKWLDQTQQIQQLDSGSRGLRNISYTMGQGTGKGFDQMHDFFNGKGYAISPIDSIRNLMNSQENIVDESGNVTGTRHVIDGDTRSMMQNSIARYERGVVNRFDRLMNPDTNATSDALSNFRPEDHSLSGATVAENTSGKLTEMIQKYAPTGLMEHAGGFGKGAIAFGAMWAASALIRKSPTPEGLQEQTQNPVQSPGGPPMGNPTARITENNGEYVNIKVNAKNANSMSEQQVAALVHQELGAMTNTKLDTNINVNDNTRNIDPNWLQGVVAKAINGGYAF